MPSRSPSKCYRKCYRPEVLFAIEVPILVRGNRHPGSGLNLYRHPKECYPEPLFAAPPPRGAKRNRASNGYLLSGEDF
jgi:hypothetical protein